MREAWIESALSKIINLSVFGLPQLYAETGRCDISLPVSSSTRKIGLDMALIISLVIFECQKKIDFHL